MLKAFLEYLSRSGYSLCIKTLKTLPRHPSQLYEGFLEGLFLFLLLWVIRVKFPRLGYGVLTGLFFVLYASGRIFVEQFREPDSAMIGMLTKGQFYSLFMIGIGVAFLLWGMTKGRKV